MAEKNKNYISPREILSDKFIRGLAANGIKTDEAIIAYLLKEGIIKEIDD